MHYQDRNAHEELRDTPRRRQTPQWLPPRRYVSLVDLLFIGAAFLTAVWFLSEFGGEVWNLLKSALAVVTSAGR